MSQLPRSWGLWHHTLSAPVLYTTGSLQTRWQTPHCIAWLDESSRMAGGPCPRNGGVWHCNIIWGIQDEGLRSNMADMELGDPWDYPTIWRPSLPRPGSIASPGWMSHPRWWAICGSYPRDCIVRHCNIV